LINIRGPLLRALANAGHEVLACAPEKNEEIAEALRSLGTSYHSVKLERTRMNPLQDARFVLSYTRFLRKKRPEIRESASNWLPSQNAQTKLSHSSADSLVRHASTD